MTTDEFVELLLAPPDRWALVKRFVAHWHAPLREGDGYPPEVLAETGRRLGFPLPEALREWYQLAGLREDLTARQDHLRSPEVLMVERGLLFFHVENQGCCRWGIREQDVRLADPPVFLDDDGPRRVQEAGSVSEFALHMLLQETVITGPGPKIDDLGLTREHDSQLRARLVDLGLPYWHWPMYPRVLLALPGRLDVLVELFGQGDHAQAIVAARTRQALDGFLERFPWDWERFNEDEDEEDEDEAQEEDEDA